MQIMRGEQGKRKAYGYYFEITYNSRVGNKKRSKERTQSRSVSKMEENDQGYQKRREFQARSRSSISRFKCCTEVGEVHVQARRLLVVASKRGFDSDESRNCFHIALAFQKTLLVESMEPFPKQSNLKMTPMYSTKTMKSIQGRIGGTMKQIIGVSSYVILSSGLPIPLHKAKVTRLPFFLPCLQTFKVSSP